MPINHHDEFSNGVKGEPTGLDFHRWYKIEKFGTLFSRYFILEMRHGTMDFDNHKTNNFIRGAGVYCEKCYQFDSKSDAFEAFAEIPDKLKNENKK